MIGSTVVTQTAAATAQATNANIATCKMFMTSFIGNGATVEQSQLYASCTRLVYPTSVGVQPDQILLLKVAVIIMLIGGLIGIVKGYGKHIRPFESRGFTVTQSAMMWGGVPTLLFAIAVGITKILFL